MTPPRLCIQRLARSFGESKLVKFIFWKQAAAPCSSAATRSNSGNKLKSYERKKENDTDARTERIGNRISSYLRGMARGTDARGSTVSGAGSRRWRYNRLGARSSPRPASEWALLRLIKPTPGRSDEQQAQSAKARAKRREENPIGSRASSCTSWKDPD